MFGFLTVYTDNNSGNIHDKMVNKLFVASTKRNKMPPEKSLGVGWDSLSFLSTRYCSSSCCPTKHLIWSDLPESSRFSIVPLSFPIKCRGRQHCLCRFFGFWGISHYPLQIKRLLGPVTERGGYQRPSSMAINTTTTLDSFGLLDPAF